MIVFGRREGPQGKDVRVDRGSQGFPDLLPCRPGEPLLFVMVIKDSRPELQGLATAGRIVRFPEDLQ